MTSYESVWKHYIFVLSCTKTYYIDFEFIIIYTHDDVNKYIIFASYQCR